MFTNFAKEVGHPVMILMRIQLDLKLKDPVVVSHGTATVVPPGRVGLGDACRQAIQGEGKKSVFLGL